jgi:mRNA-degrading endonuclease YafQ of YafQ-DinJ toxin-antitoxin module
MNISDLLKDKNNLKEALRRAIDNKDKKLAEVLIPIVRDPELTCDYALQIAENKIKDEWEEIIAQSWIWSYTYSFEVLEKPFPKGEDAIAQESWSAYMYAYNVIKGRFVKGEEVIIKDKKLLKSYIDFLKQINKLEEFLKDHPEVKL